MSKGIVGFFASLYVFLWGCSTGWEVKSSKPTIVATTAMLGDAAQSIFGDTYEVHVLMGPGSDPHAYRPSPADANQLKEAVLVFCNGAHLEGKMARLWSHIEKKVPVIEANQYVPDSLRILHDTETDPHFWFDPLLWHLVIDSMMTRAGSLLPEKSALWNQRKSDYLDTLMAVHHEGVQLFSGISVARRMLISTHDAFSYFGHRFQFTLRSLQGTSTLSGFGNYDINKLAQEIKDKQVYTVFGEQHQSERGMEAVIRQAATLGHTLHLGSPLLTDAPSKEQPTLAAMWRYNFKVIASGLTSNAPHVLH